MAGSLAALLLLLFWRALLPGHTVFSNDGPLGAVIAQTVDLGSSFFGVWQNLNWLGGPAPNALPGVTQTLTLICSTLFGAAHGPFIFSKILAPFALLFLGCSAWVCFRAWKFHPAVCVLGGLAVGLNSDFLSTATWGVAAQPIGFGLDFLALAALADQTSPRRWLRAMLAGFAVGFSIMEAFDIAAIFSLFVGAYTLVHALVGPGSPGQRATRAAGRLSLVVVCSACLASAALTTLVLTQIKDVAGMAQDANTKAQRWAEATRWSLPKQETLAVAVPGLFGFRMDTPKDIAYGAEYFENHEYWGMVGSGPEWDAWFANGKRGPAPPAQSARFNGGGIYAGVLVVILAAFAVFQSVRKRDSVFSDEERKLVWFWTVVAVGSLLLSYGRFAPFYQFLYAMPYASTFRNPAKFIHVTEWALLILFAYGLHGLSQSWMGAASETAQGFFGHFRGWWSKASRGHHVWVLGSAVALVLGVVAWFAYGASREHLMRYIESVGFDATGSAPMADASIRQAGWALIFFTAGLLSVVLIMSGYFRAARMKYAVGVLGLLLVADLFPSDIPYIVVWDYVQKYATNPVIDRLREPATHPYEQRVAVLPFPPPDQDSALFRNLYELEWKQHHWQYYGVQSLDIIMNPRAPEAYVGFESAMMPGTNLTKIARRWQLTNTRYLLGPAGYVEVMNQQLDPGKRRFRVVLPFAVVTKPGIGVYTKLEEVTAEPNNQGPMALIEFTGALPRARLYNHWVVSTNDNQTLGVLGNSAFDPESAVLVAEPIGLPAPPPAATNSDKVTITSYASKRIELKASATARSVLLFNDRYDPNWSVLVDGKPAKLLRCNYLMRGVEVPPGEHTVLFRYAPPFGIFYASLASIIVALGVLGFVLFARPTEK